MTRRKQKKVIYAALIGLAMIIAFFLLKSYLFPSFASGFNKIQRIEVRYNGDFRNEKINDTKINREDFDKFVEDLEAFNKNLLGKKNTTDVQALNKFTNIRTDMLKSEKFFKLGDDIGDIGKATDSDGFKCSEMNYLLNAAYYFNRSWTYGIKVQLDLDDLLVQYKQVPKLRELVGIDDTKTRFFKSDLRMVKRFSLNNIDSLTYYCGYTEGAPKTLKKFELVAPPEGDKRIISFEREV